MTGIRIASILGMALALGAPAQADDPADPAMQDAAAIAQDREMIRRLNEDMLRQVTERDAGYARGWAAYRAQAQQTHPAQIAYARDQRRYEQARADYERAMADWQADVRACRAGYHDRC